MGQHTLEIYTYRRTYNGRLKAAILDWDGTIVDHGSCASLLAVIELFRRHGVQVDILQVRATMGLGQRTQLETICDIDQVALQWEQIYGIYPTQRDIYNLYRELIRLQPSGLNEFSQPINGALEAIRVLRDMKMQICTTTSYTTEMQRILAAEAGRNGFEPKISICTDHVHAGRPHPWMCFKAALELQTYPMESMVKVGDTIPDIEEGLNAGMWTIAIARTGNEVGLNDSDLEMLSEKERNARIIKAREKLSRGGAHYVVDSMEDVPQVVEEINRRLSDGERP